MQAKASAAGAALLVALTQAASAAVWGFGDSNIDTGAFTAPPYSGEIAFDTYLQKASLYGIGKQTNNPGPMSIEVLASLLGGTATPAFKPGGTNFATSGAKNVNTNTTANGGFPNAVATVTQMKNFAGSRTVGANDVFLIDSGGNDVRYALTLNPTDQQPYMQQQAAGLAKMIKALQLKGGATRLIIANQPESFGTPAQQAARQFYDAALRSSLGALGVAYVWGDRNRVRRDIVADPAGFNMDHVDNQPDHIACPGGPEAGFPSGWALLCSPSSPVITPAPFAQRTLFADDGHWASNGQRVLGSYYYCLVRLNWPTVLPPPWPLPPRPPYTCDVFSEFTPPPPRL